MRSLTTLFAALSSLALISCYAKMADEAAGGGGGEGGSGGGGGAEVAVAPIRVAIDRGAVATAGRAGYEHAAGTQLVDRVERPAIDALPPNVVGPVSALPPSLAVHATPETRRPTTLSNNEGLCPHAWIAPLPGEEGQFAVARLTPSDYPFEVERIRYKLDNGGLKEGRLTCSAAWDHAAEIFVGDQATPPGRPKILERWSVKGVNSSDPIVTHEKALEAPITLEKGQHLFIAVRSAGRHPNTLCLAACGGSSVDSSRNYWSKEGPPYPWPKLSSFNLDYNFQFEALGSVKGSGARQAFLAPR